MCTLHADQRRLTDEHRRTVVESDGLKMNLIHLVQVVCKSCRLKNPPKQEKKKNNQLDLNTWLAYC